MATGTPTATRIRGKEREDLAEALRARVSGEVRFDPFSRVLYSTDASIYQMEPVGVVIPRSVDDVLAVMEVAKKNNVPVLPRAGGTSLAGQTVNHAIVIDFSKYLNQVIEVNPEEMWVRVQPGIVLDQLNRELAVHGLQYAPDPTTSNRACVGGGIGNNSCGAHSVIYGKTLDHVKEVEVILSDGTQAHFGLLEAHQLEAKLSGTGLESDIYREVRRIAQDNLPEITARYPQIMRRVSGYNLDQFLSDDPFNMARMVVGSEGTLCLVTEAKLNLVPRPTMTALSVLHFADIVQASEATREVLKHQPSSIEVMDKILLDRCRESLGHAGDLAFIEGDPGALLAVEFYGESEAELTSKTDALKDDMAHKKLGYACVNLLDQGAQGSVWNVRKSGLGLLMSVHGDSKPLPFVEDTAVDPENLGPFVARFDEIVRSHNTEAAYYGHASVGCLHIRPLVNLKEAQGVETMVSIAEEISDLVREFGGSLSGEHGDGIVRGVWTEKMFGPEIYQLFREVKSTFDPQGIMNPGKIIDCPPMTENLRYGPGYHASSFPTKLDFSLDTNYAGAVEMCNGMGACRKLDGGMCPSYIATREEEHSTRGRANLLRAAMSGQLPEGAITSRRLYEALDLCLECKACKAECDSGVDMAKLKYEFLDHYFAANGMPLRNKVFGHINKINRMGSRFAPFSNWAAQSPIGKLVSTLVLGIHPRRSLPPFARETLPKWFEQRRKIPRSSRVEKGGSGGISPASTGDTAGVTTKGSVVLFNDTFMNYNYPQVGRAAVELLEAAGFSVTLANAKCCGRPMISKGMLDEATAHARYNVDLLHAYADQGIPIIGCEPSCLLTFRDEYLELVNNERARKVAQHSYLIDEFLMMLQDKGELNLEFRNVPKKILFHGHCHQKALVGTASSLGALRLPPGNQVELVNAGCCGMAGSFGFEREHYQVSMTIGEHALFPAVNAKDPDWEIAVMGVSCRQQIEDGTGRRARHLVEVLRDSLP
ncbi:MAG: FAD-binding protein [Chloroflexi bacterium]|nr:FAD-binding protein [Chloroflexota bacterium]